MESLGRPRRPAAGAGAAPVRTPGYSEVERIYQRNEQKGRILDRLQPGVAPGAVLAELETTNHEELDQFLMSVRHEKGGGRPLGSCCLTLAPSVSFGLPLCSSCSRGRSCPGGPPVARALPAAS